MTEASNRALAAIVSIDIAGYSALSERDEAAAVLAVETLRNHARRAVDAHRGRIFNTAGDGVMLVFASATDALEATLLLMQTSPTARFGVHIGEVTETHGGDLLGHDVNVAARLQQVAPQGGALVSEQVQRAVHGKRAVQLRAHGPLTLNKMATALQTYLLVASEAAGEPRAREMLIAVLPFDNLSGASDMVFFSDGVSEDIMRAVAQSTKLKVAARSSSFQFRGADKAPRHVAAELGATHVLDGSVRRSGDKVRINAHLIACESQIQLWSDRFDRDLSDVFALQDEIAAAVAKALKAAFAPLLNASPIDPAAYDLYLRARALIAGSVDFVPPIALLEESVALAPDFAQAWAALAVARGGLVNMANNNPVQSKGLRARTADAAERALALDPHAATAYVALSALEPRCGAFIRRDQLLQQARDAAPNDPLVLNASGLAASAVGRLREAFTYASHAHEVDPLYAQGVNWHASTLCDNGFINEGLHLFEDGIRRWPAFQPFLNNALSVAAQVGDWERVDALVAHANKVAITARDFHAIAAAAQMLRERDPVAIARVLAQFRDRVARTERVSFNRMCFLSALGLVDEIYDAVDGLSFAHLFAPDGMLERGDYGLHNLFNGIYPALRRDPRFVTLCAKLGLCDYWVKTERWPDCTAEVAPHYDFKRACAVSSAR